MNLEPELEALPHLAEFGRGALKGSWDLFLPSQENSTWWQEVLPSCFIPSPLLDVGHWILVTRVHVWS